MAWNPVIGAQVGSIEWWQTWVGDDRPTQELYALGRLKLLNENPGAAEFAPETPELQTAQWCWDHFHPTPPRKVGWLRLRFQVLSRDNFRCRYCGRSTPDVALQVDHIQPRSKGGEDTLENLVAACDECNLGKLDMILPAPPILSFSSGPSVPDPISCRRS